MKNYHQPIVELIPVLYGEIATDLISASSNGDPKNSLAQLNFDEILSGHYTRT